MTLCPTCGGALDGGVCPQCATHAKTPSVTGAATAPQPPPDIPGYRITSHLGEGGMGSLYLAEETALGRRVAIKLISHRIAGDALSSSRFLREARTLATIEHPHVVRVYSFGEAAGTPYLVMEYVEGETLAQRLARTGRLPVDEALRMMRQIADALDAAWERKVVHRDIKPSNILLDRRNRVLVADFGLAKPAQDDMELTLTNSTSIVGTPHYVSPEQAQGKDVDFRSDIYSCGIMLYQMLTGERPFEGSTPVAVIAKHLHEPLPPLNADAQVERLVRSMTEKDPANRPQSYAAIHRAIDAILGTTPTRSDDVPTMQLTPPPARRKLVRMPLVYFAVVAIALAVIFAATVKRVRPPQAPPKDPRLVVAVAPFYGPDDDSAREGKLMAALVEREIVQKLGTNSVRVIGIDDTKKPLHSHDEARELAKTLSANAVIWGEAFTLRKETEIQPHVTVIPAEREKKEIVENSENAAAEIRAEDAFARRDRGGSTLKLEAESPNQIELRKTSASGIGDVVTLLAGIRELDQGDASGALEVLALAPQTPETQRYEVLALLQLEKRDEAQAMLEKAIAVEPNDAGSHAVLGDILVAQHKYGPAAASYARALAAKTPFTSHRGILAGGRLYVKETYVSRRYTVGKENDTPYLLAIDPVTERIVDRYCLPAPAESFAPAGNGFTVAWKPKERTEKLTFRDGRFARPLALPVTMLQRVRGMKAATAVAVNFAEWAPRKFRDRAKPAELSPSAQMDDDAPKTLTALEAELRRRIERDPTQPWNSFLLAVTLDAEKRPAEANAAFKQLLDRNYNVPYYEFSWMLGFLERMRRDAWADALFVKTLAQRKRLAQPVGFTLMIERIINANFARQAACNADPVRAYPILQRTRLLTGMMLEAEDLGSAAWEKWFRQRGDTVSAERERRVRASIRNEKLNYYRVTSLIDYALDFAAGALAALVVLLFAILAAAFRRARHAPSSSAPRMPAGADIAVFAALAAGAAYYVAQGMSEMHGAALLLAIELGVATALIVHARTSKGLTMFDILAAISRRERAILAAGYAIVFAAALVLTANLATVTAITRIPIGFADALGNPSVVADVESLNTARDSKASRYLAAVANHYAGNTARAKQLYLSVPTTAAAANLKALERGAPPPIAITPNDVYDALQWNHIGDLIREATVSTPGIGLVLAVLGVPMLLLILSRPRGDLAVPDSPRRWKLTYRIGLTLFPGGYDVATGRWWRAYAILFAAAFVALPVITFLREPLLPAPGPVTADALPSLTPVFPLPFDGPSDTPMQYAHWAFRMAMPYAWIFWPAVVALAAFAIASHLRRVPRIWRRQIEPSEMPTAITAA